MSKCFPRRQLGDALGVRMGWHTSLYTFEEKGQGSHEGMLYVLVRSNPTGTLKPMVI